MAARLVALLNPLDLSRRHTYELAAGTRLLEWLDTNEPAGGHLQRTVYIGGREILDPEYRVTDRDAVLVTFTPGAATVGLIVLKALISVAISYLLSKLFAPHGPKAGTTPAPSQVYGLGTPRNTVRLGQPIPVIYGTVICVPDFAAQPYTIFTNGEQILHALLCIGQGQHDVTELLLGDSSAARLPADVVFYQVFQPADHGSTFGRIENATGVRENVVSSSSVAGQELLAPNTGTPLLLSTYYWLAGPVLYYTSFPAFNIDMQNAPDAASKLALMPANPTLGTKLTGYLGFDGTRWLTMDFTATAYSGQSVPPYSLVPAPAPAPGATAWIGPFESCKPGQSGALLELDYVFPGGLYTMDASGNLQTCTVALQVEYTPINDAGTATGAAVLRPESFTAQTNTPQRFTRSFAVTLGRYRVRVSRTTNSDLKASTSDHVVWAGLKFKLAPPAAGTVVYGDVTLVALRLKASNGVSSDAAGAVRFRVTRRLAPLGVGTAAASSNPADAFVDIVTARYGGNRPNNADEIDQPELTASRALWAGTNGFNAVFDQPSTVWEALALAVQCVSAAPLPVGSRMSLIHDGPQSVPVQLFTDANIAAGSLSVTESFDTDGSPAGIRATYRDPRTFSEAVYLTPPAAPDYITLNLFGCTSASVAQQLATIAANKRRLQRTTIQFTTELEGLNCLPGDWIQVQAGMMGWAQGARVVAAAGRKLTLDRDLLWTTGAVHAIRIRDVDGTPVRVASVTRGVSDHELVLPGAPPFTLRPYGDAYEPTILSFGVNGAEITNWTVTKMTPQGSSAVQIEAVNYDTGVWAGGATYQQADPADDDAPAGALVLA
jgi:hypothetical protein